VKNEELCQVEVGESYMCAVIFL